MDESHTSPPRSETVGDLGVLVMLGTGPAVRFERVLDVPAQEAWWALTDPDGLRGWFPCSISAQRWEVGGALTFTFPQHPQLTMDGVVLECDPPWVLAYLWGSETLRFDLQPVPAGTRLVMVDEMSAPLAARNAAGWHLCLDRLAGAAPAEGSGEWQRLFALYRAAFEPSLGPQEGPPAGFEDSA